MDLNYLNRTLKKVLAKYHIPSAIRYRNIAFSSKNLADLDDVAQALRSILPDYWIWQIPGIKGAPDSLTNRKHFLQAIFQSQHDGVIIQQPEQWTSNWSLLDKQAFWSDISLKHGSTNVVLVFAESHSFHEINSNYFKQLPLDGLNVRIWLPIRAEI